MRIYQPKLGSKSFQQWISWLDLDRMVKQSQGECEISCEISLGIFVCVRVFHGISMDIMGFQNATFIYPQYDLTLSLKIAGKKPKKQHDIDHRDDKSDKFPVIATVVPWSSQIHHWARIWLKRLLMPIDWRLLISILKKKASEGCVQNMTAWTFLIQVSCAIDARQLCSWAIWIQPPPNMKWTPPWCYSLGFGFLDKKQFTKGGCAFRNSSGEC